MSVYQTMFMEYRKRNENGQVLIQHLVYKYKISGKTFNKGDVESVFLCVRDRRY